MEVNSLSLAGRITLVQLVVSSIHFNLFNANFTFAISLVDEVEKLGSRFIWEIAINQRSIILCLGKKYVNLRSMGGWV